MNLLFSRRREHDEFTEAIRPELNSLPTPEPRPELLGRILASREAGNRVILPDVSPMPDRAYWPYFTAAAIAAGLLLVVVPRAPRDSAGQDDDFRASTSLFGEAVFAQTVTPARAAPPIRITRAQAIHPMALRFLRRVRDTAGKTRESQSELDLAADSVGGAPAWRISTTDLEPAGALRQNRAETVYVARSNLAILRRDIHVSPYHRFARINVHQRAFGDSVTGRMTTDGPSIGSGRTFARKLQPQFGPYVSEAFAPFLLMAVQLQQGWRGSASLLGWAVVPNDVFLPIELRVEGAEKIRVPAGTFDCWKMTIRFGGRKISYWARKSDGLGVSVRDDSQSSTTGTRETLLLSVR